MLVSIITPNFNGSKFITETIQSVISQTYEKWELIIVDDGSTDDSENKIQPFLSEKIHFVKRPQNRKKGGNTCRNIGIEQAKGDYLIFLDSDDILAPYCLEQRVSAINSYGKLDFIVFNMENFHSQIGDGFLFTRLETKNPLNHFLGQDCIWQTTSPIWKSSFVKEIGMFNERYLRLQDPEMVVRALNHKDVTYKLEPNSKPDAYYRGSSSENKDKYKPMYDSLCMFIEDFYPNNTVSNECKQSMFYLLCFCHFLFSTEQNASRYPSLCTRLDLKKFNLLSHLFFIICSRYNLVKIFRRTIIKKLFCFFTFKLHKKPITDR